MNTQLPRRAVVLLSGGLDSATTLAIARSEGFDCYCLSLDYGQRHRVELDAAANVARALQAKEHRIVQLGLDTFGGSALTDPGIAVPMDEDAGGIPVTYVGHPLADMLPVDDGRSEARQLLGLADQQPVFALLPGSRQSELQYMAETFIETARAIHERLPEALFLVPLATRETRLLFETALYRCNARELPIRMLFGHAHDAMKASDAVLVASGTATLEAALLKRPMAIAYKMASFSYRLMRRMGYLPYVGLPNILAGKFVVPEFIQDDATPENMAQALLNFYADKRTCALIAEEFREIHLQLKQNTAEKAATAVINSLPQPVRNDVFASA